jgi:predicted nuclease of predicted toxin-antitoxin system
MVDDNDWFEFGGDLSDIAGGRPRKLRLYADHNLPKVIVDEIRGAKIPILTAFEDQHASRDDKAIYERARKLKRVLLTQDEDFWDDRRFSLRYGPGLILVSVAPEKTEKIVEVLATFYAIFAQHFSLDWWPGLKARLVEEESTIKGVSWTGGVFEYRLRLAGGSILFREVRSGLPVDMDE